MNAVEARELVAAARAEKLFCMEAMWTRFLPHIAQIRRLVAEGALGEIVTVSADHGQWFAKDPEFRLFAPELGGGALLDLGVYPVSFASMLLGAPSSIVALIDPPSPASTVRPRCCSATTPGAQAVLSCTLSGQELDPRRDRRHGGSPSR